MARNDIPVVSVVVPTYQHAAYIEQCIEGILMQRTSFPIEVLIGEDESTDGTREICQRLAAAYPDRITLFLRSRKDVIHIMGRPSGRANLLGLLKAARGCYIAMCDGDDYWTDPLKLQKQVDYLETHQGTVLCFHAVDVLKDGELVDDFIVRHRTDVSDIQELARYGNYIHTPSVVYRNVLKEFPPAILSSPAADYFIYMLLARHGTIKCLPDRMAVYRHGAGIFSTLSLIDMMSNTIQTFSAIRSAADPDIAAILDERIAHLVASRDRKIKERTKELLKEARGGITQDVMDEFFSMGFLLRAVGHKVMRKLGASRK